MVQAPILQTVGRPVPFPGSPKTFRVEGLAFLGPPLTPCFWCFWPWPYLAGCWSWQAHYTAVSSHAMISVAEHNRDFSLAPAVCPPNFGGETCPVSSLLRDVSWWSCHHLEIAGSCSRRKGSKMLLSRWTPVPISLTTKRHVARPNWKRVGNYHPRLYLKAERKQIPVSITLESLPSRGAALFVNIFALTKPVLSPLFSQSTTNPKLFCMSDF